MSFAKWLSFCIGLNVLKDLSIQSSLSKIGICLEHSSKSVAPDHPIPYVVLSSVTTVLIVWDKWLLRLYQERFSLLIVAAWEETEKMQIYPIFQKYSTRQQLDE